MRKEINMDKNVRKFVEEFYAAAARKPVERLCCPTAYRATDLSHIPGEALDISYGCGSPVVNAGIAEGEIVLDLGSGGGVDCFIAARFVGKTGRVIGVDMTDEMLSRANAAKPKVSSNLGYDVVEFRKGLLEEIPLEDETVDMVMSNCVINLSPDKNSVLAEVARVLKHGGRICISDVVAEKDPPEHVRADKKLWGECISGALTETEFMDTARKAGLYGIQVTTRSPYKEIGGMRFFSVIFKGYKFKKRTEDPYKGHMAAYNGPFRSVVDDDEQEFPAGVPVEVSADKAEKLSRPPYREMFTVTEPGSGGEPMASWTKKG